MKLSTFTIRGEGDGVEEKTSFSSHVGRGEGWTGGLT